jgi:hypothetical protein
MQKPQLAPGLCFTQGILSSFLRWPRCAVARKPATAERGAGQPGAGTDSSVPTLMSRTSRSKFILGDSERFSVAGRNYSIAKLGKRSRVMSRNCSSSKSFMSGLLHISQYNLSITRFNNHGSSPVRIPGMHAQPT